MQTVGLLHTASVHEATFSQLLTAADRRTGAQHVVDASLLDDARARGGVDDELRRRLLVRLREAARGAAAVLCTCSTLGAAAEALAPGVGVSVLRVDRPMAEVAVGAGRRIGVVYALDSTVTPTCGLLDDVASRAGVVIEVVRAPCPGAWDRFEAGDLRGYLDDVAATARQVAGAVDVVVLAQASMAPVVDAGGWEVPVLASPSLAVRALLAAAAAAS